MATYHLLIVLLICLLSSVGAISNRKGDEGRQDQARTYTKPISFQEETTRNRYHGASGDRNSLTGERDNQPSGSSYSDGYGLYAPEDTGSNYHGSYVQQGSYYGDRDSDHYQGKPFGGSPYPVTPYYGPDKYALALKGLLLPLVGVALLGAAASLASNPILLQLGVISGRRRRRRRSTKEFKFKQF